VQKFCERGGQQFEQFMYITIVTFCRPSIKLCVAGRYCEILRTETHFYVFCTDVKLVAAMPWPLESQVRIFVGKGVCVCEEKLLASVFLSVRMYRANPHLPDFCEISYLGFC